MSDDYSLLSDEHCSFPTPPTCPRSTPHLLLLLLLLLPWFTSPLFYMLQFAIILSHFIFSYYNITLFHFFFFIQTWGHCIIKHHAVLFLTLSLFYYFLHHLFIFSFIGKLLLNNQILISNEVSLIFFICIFFTCLVVRNSAF